MKNLNLKPILCGALAVLLAVAVTGCQTTRQGSKTYTRGEAMEPLNVSYGTVISVAYVTIEREESGVGAAAGGVAGGVAGSTVGDGSGRTLATVAGAIVGAVVGSAAERAAGTKQALEIEVELDNGETYVVVQEADDVFHPGDRVRVIETSYGRMRVRH